MKKETLFTGDFDHSSFAINLASFSLPDRRFKSLIMYASVKNESMFFRVVDFDDQAVEVARLETAVQVYNKLRALPREA